MSRNKEGGQIFRSSLGRNAFIGELYDARSENLTNRSLFKHGFPSHFIRTQDNSRTEMEYHLIDNISDRFELLKVEGDVRVSLLCDAIKVEGSGKFLKEDKKSHRSVSCCFLCKYQTVLEKLFGSFDEIIKYVDVSALQDTEYTHFVSEINWGANFLLTLESSCSSDSERQEIEGAFKGEFSRLSKLISCGAQMAASKQDTTVEKKNNFNFNMSADILTDEVPDSIESFIKLLPVIPKYLKKVNDGRGKPLNYVLVPLSVVRKIAKIESAAGEIIKSIDESFLISLTCLFEDISEVKRNLYDLLQDVTEYKKYVSDEDLTDAKKHRESLMVKESELKLMISEDLANIKSGDKSLKDLIRQIEKFRNQQLKLHNYEDYLESCEHIRQKISAVKNYISSGAVYLGKKEKFTDIVNQNVTDEFIVLVISSKIEENDTEMYQNNCHYFLTLVHDAAVNTRYVVLDLDLQNTNRFINFELQTAKIFRFKGPDLISSDLYKEYLVERDCNLMRVAEALEIDPVQHRPGNRVLLEMICPGFKKGSCGSDALKWKCFRCKAGIEYGFDNYFYCFCGKAPTTAFEYRCGGRKHGPAYVSPDGNFLTNQLSVLNPFKELNILILGQSGVGKSTWINSITNYLSYEKLQDAKEGGVICEIPISITAYSKSKQKYTIKVGRNRDSEVTAVGDSATQYCHTYSFLWEDRYVRLIDTPGIGDTRGIEQDKKNMKNIIDHIGNLKELHGICCLMKANDNRINAIFSYCLKELLIHLHKSVARNIVFCFTNSRNSFYNPGAASALLDNLLDKMDTKSELSLGPHNMFCLDNEAFLFLCTMTEPEIHYDDDLVTSFGKSWDLSLKETRRMFNTIRSFHPHKLKETLSLVTARSRILSLTKPIAEISKTIQINLSSIERKKEEIQNSNKTIEELKSKLNVTIYELKAYNLNYPRTVCTAASCVKYVSTDSSEFQSVEYKTHCHTRCYLEDVVTSTVNNYKLMQCSAMNNGKCTVCGCRWEVHMHITYGQEVVAKPIEDSSVKNQILEKTTDKEKIEEFVKSLGERTEKYKKEQEVLVQTSAKFGMFLKQNAITVYNDGVEEYLKYLIDEEQKKPYKSKDDISVLENLRETLKQYEAEVMVLQEVVNKCGDKAEQLTSLDIFRLEEELYKLELTGKDIKKCVEMSRMSSAACRQYAETPLKMSCEKNKRSNKKMESKDKKYFFGLI